jgi:replicative DNA helicase
MSALDNGLPCNLEAERCILGGIILDNDQTGDAVEVLTSDDFYSPYHRAVYTAVIDLYTQSLPITPINIQNALKTQGNEKSLVEILGLTNGIPAGSSVSDYIETVRVKSVSRNFIKKCNYAMNDALNDVDPISEIIDRTEQELYNMRDIDTVEGPQQLDELILESVEEIKQRSKEGNSLLGLSTGFNDLDRLTGGLQKTDLIILAARPSMGKSAFSLDIAKGITKKDPDSVVAYFSMEMSKRQCTDRLLCSLARIDSTRYRTGFMSPSEWERLADVASELASKKIVFDDKSSCSVLDIKSKARHIANKYKRLDIIIVDYLQLMVGSRKSDSRQQEVSEISRDLKALAKDLKVPVVALSQLSRSCESRQDKRPMLSDLRESGAIEQDADLVAFLYRDEYYEPRPDNQGVAELLVSKHRNGATGNINLAFLKDYAMFGDLSSYAEDKR